MIGIVDYGVGNLFSLHSSLVRLGRESRLCSDEKSLEKADRLILPGVGAFGDAAEKLEKTGLGDAVIRQANAGKPLLGICLGMQLLFERSLEYGEHAGLGLIEGEVRPIREVIPADYKIPHIGWNGLRFEKECPLFKYICEGDFVYFVHSYYAAKCAKNTVATAEYGAPLTAAVQNKNVFGTQFHPEKSGEVGLNILRAFCEV